MIELENLKVLFFLLPLLLVCLIGFQIHKKSLEWIDQNISSRFRKNFTKYEKILYLRIHIVIYFFLILILAFSTSAPFLVGEINVTDNSGKIFILLDGSFSMLPDDTFTNPKTGKKPYDRLAEEQEFAEELVDLLPEYSFGVLSFSQFPVLHSNITKDLVQIKTIIRTMLLHNFENTGTSYKSVLKELIRLYFEIDDSIQIVLLTDGEVPKGYEENLEEEISIFKKNKIPVHTVGIGSEKGGSVEFFISYSEERKIDNLAKNDKSDSTGTKKVQVNKKVIKSIWTKRNNSILKKISDETGGMNLVIEKNDSPVQLAEKVKKIVSNNKNKKKSEGEFSLTPFLLIIAICVFLFERLIFLRKK